VGNDSGNTGKNRDHPIVISCDGESLLAYAAFYALLFAGLFLFASYPPKLFSRFFVF